MKRLLMILMICLSGPAFAGGAPENMAQVELLPGWRTATGSHMAALRVELAAGWKTYWRAPGEAGIPPSFDFAGSSNVGGVAFHWPVPEVFQANGMTSIGYSDRLILPIEVHPGDAGAPSVLRANIDLGICRDICVPLSVRVAADLPVEPARPNPQIRAALADRPLSAAEVGAGAIRCDVAPASDGVSLSAAMQVPSMGGGEFAVIELADSDLWVSDARIDRQGGQLSAQVDVVPMSGGPVALDRSSVRVTVLGAKGAVELVGCT